MEIAEPLSRASHLPFRIGGLDGLGIGLVLVALLRDLKDSEDVPAAAITPPSKTHAASNWYMHAPARCGVPRDSET